MVNSGCVDIDVAASHFFKVGAIETGEIGMKRKSFIQIALMLCSKPVWALGKNSELDIAELILNEDSISRPLAWEQGLYTVMQSTSIEANPRAVQISPESEELFWHPFSVLIGKDAFSPLSDKAIENIRRYLIYGGFLLVDDASGNANSAFKQSVSRMCERVFPTNQLLPLPADHSVYRSFFLLNRPAGRNIVSDVLEGIQLGQIWPLLYSSNDISGALDRREDGNSRYPVIPGGEEQRTETVKLLINIIMYALTSNYKHDQAHVAELMRRGDL
jgi:hypothetical protein